MRGVYCFRLIVRGSFGERRVCCVLYQLVFEKYRIFVHCYIAIKRFAKLKLANKASTVLHEVGIMLAHNTQYYMILECLKLW